MSPAAVFRCGVWMALMGCCSLVCVSFAYPNGKGGQNLRGQNTFLFPVEKYTTDATPKPPVLMQLSCEKKADNLLEKSQIVLQNGINDLVSQYNDWGKLLAPAPSAISILGQLILMSNQIRDFPIDDPPPRNGFQHVERPKSFRSTLLQISHSGHGAFLKAHTNMKEIRVNSKSIFRHIENAVRQLMSKHERVIKIRLPSTLSKIKNTTKANEALITEVVANFQLVINLIEETIQAATSTKSNTENLLHEVTIERNLTVMEQKFSEQEATLLEQKRAALTALFEQLQHNQKNILVRTLYDDEDFVINLNKDRLSQTGGRHLKHKDAFYNKNWTWKYWYRERSVETNPCVEQNSQQLIDLLIAFSRYRTSYEQWQGSQYLHQKSFSHQAIVTIQAFERIIGELYNCPDIEKIAAKGANLIKVLQNVNFTSVKKTDSRPGLAEIQEIILMVSGVRATANVTQKIAAANSTRTYEKTNLMETWEKVYQHQSQMIEEMVNATMKIIEINKKQMEIRSGKTSLILQKIANLDVTKVTYKEVLVALQDGLDELGKLKAVWSNVNRFFDSVQLFVKTASEHIVQFTDTIREHSEDVTQLQDDYLYNELMENIGKSNEAAFLVHGIADMYVNVSDTYIVDRIASLDRLSTMVNKNADKNEIAKEKAQLSTNAESASKGIEKFIQEHEKRLKETLEKKHTEILEEYKWVRSCLDSQEREFPWMDFKQYDWFQLKLRFNGKALDVPHERKNITNLGESTYVHMWDSHGGDNQLWFADDEKIIRAVATGFCLTSKGFLPALVAVEPCENKSNQRWSLVNNEIVRLDNTYNWTYCLIPIPSNSQPTPFHGAHITEVRCLFSITDMWDPIIVFKAGSQPIDD